MKTFKQKWNLRTLKKIRAEFVASRSDFLCLGSETFRDLWVAHKGEIIALGMSYREGAATPDYTPTHRDVLFYCVPLPDWHTFRLGWLDHEIAKRQRRPRRQKAPPTSKQS